MPFLQQRSLEAEGISEYANTTTSILKQAVSNLKFSHFFVHDQ